MILSALFMVLTSDGNSKARCVCVKENRPRLEQFQVCVLCRSNKMPQTVDRVGADLTLYMV